MTVDKRVLIGSGIVALVILWLMLRRYSRNIIQAPATKVDGFPSVRYVVPPLNGTDTGGSTPSGSPFDWIGRDDCGCNGSTAQNALVITSIVAAPRATPGYVYSPAYSPVIPSALKGIPFLGAITGLFSGDSYYQSQDWNAQKTFRDDWWA